MIVLGLHGYDADSGAALICDGEMFFISKERLTRKTYDGGFPEESIYYVMDQAGLKKFGDIDMVVFDAMNNQSPRMRRSLKKMGFSGKVLGISHHDAHAAAAYFSGPFEEAAILVITTCGSFVDEIPGHPNFYAPHHLGRELHSMYVGRHGNLNVLTKTFSSPGWSVGPGTMLALGAMMVGFSALDGEKLMALAAIGNRDNVFPKCCFMDFEGSYLASGEPEISTLDRDNLPYYSNLFFRGLPPRKSGWPIRRIHCELARAVKSQSYSAIISMMRFLFDATGLENLCLGGGIIINSPEFASGRRATPFKQVFVNKASSGGGAAIGAALHGINLVAGRVFKPKQFSSCHGKIYSDEDVLHALGEFPQVEFIRPLRLETQTAELLAEGKSCGWFRGGGENGSSTPGGHIVLSSPRDPDKPHHINASVMLRESFHPCEIVMLATSSDCFDIYGETRLTRETARMLYGEGKIMYAVRRNNALRVQLVNRENHEALFLLLEAFHSRTAVPALLKTSFNCAGEPIVETPVDALNCFVRTELDFLVLEDRLVFKKGIRHD